MDLDGTDDLKGADIARTYYERVYEGQGEPRLVLVVETPIELGPRQGTAGAVKLAALEARCKERLTQAPPVDEVRLVRRKTSA